MTPINPIILALDYDNLNDVKHIVSEVRPYIGMLKIGLELYTACGQAALSLARSFDLPIFLDLKLHDIPRTVEKTVKVLCDKLSAYSGPHFLSVHCFGGQEMCQRAWEAAKGSNVKIVGVTLLTSLDRDDLYHFGFDNLNATQKTMDLASIATGVGIKHLVCATAPLTRMRQYLDGDYVLITPGIRAKSDLVYDHKQIATATQALQNGADWLVIGRPITAALDPMQAAKDLEIEVEKYRHG